MGSAHLGSFEFEPEIPGVVRSLIFSIPCTTTLILEEPLRAREHDCEDERRWRSLRMFLGPGRLCKVRVKIVLKQSGHFVLVVPWILGILQGLTQTAEAVERGIWR